MTTYALRDSFIETGSLGERLMCLCAYVTLFYEGGFKANSRELLHFYEAVLPLIRDDITFFDVDGRNKPKKIKDSAFELMPFWASEESEDRGIYGLRLESGASPHDISNKGFYLYEGLTPGFIKLFMPCDFLEQSPTNFLELARRAAGSLRFISGHAGFGIHVDENYNTSKEGGKIYHLSQRHMGVDLYSPIAVSRLVKHGITNINWLTFVGEGFLEKLGGRLKLKSELAVDRAVIVHDLAQGAMIQAGAAPSMGDVKAGGPPPHYRSVGHALRALRIPDEFSSRAGRVGGEQNTQAWFNRFF